MSRAVVPRQVVPRSRLPGALRCAGVLALALSSAALLVQNPCGVQREPVHAAPAGRKVPPWSGAVAEVVAGGHVVEWLGWQLRHVVPHPVQSWVGEADLVQSFLLQVLVDERG